jgi:cell division protein FtsX
MNKLFIALLIGSGAGALDIIPMLLRKAAWHEIAVPFVHWLMLGVLIAYVQMPVHSALKGSIVAVMTTLPILIGYTQTKPGAVLPILGISIVLGAAVGWLTQRFAN